jgi:hypothetical protein
VDITTTTYIIFEVSQPLRTVAITLVLDAASPVNQYAIGTAL